MNRDTKRSLKIVGKVDPRIVGIQVEDYCLSNYKIKIVNNELVNKK